MGAAAALMLSGCLPVYRYGAQTFDSAAEALNIQRMHLDAMAMGEPVSTRPLLGRVELFLPSPEAVERRVVRRTGIRDKRVLRYRVARDDNERTWVARLVIQRRLFAEAEVIRHDGSGQPVLGNGDFGLWLRGGDTSTPHWELLDRSGQPPRVITVDYSLPEGSPRWESWLASLTDLLMAGPEKGTGQ